MNLRILFALHCEKRLIFYHCYRWILFAFIKCYLLMWWIELYCFCNIVWRLILFSLVGRTWIFSKYCWRAFFIFWEFCIVLCVAFIYKVLRATPYKLIFCFWLLHFAILRCWGAIFRKPFNYFSFKLFSILCENFTLDKPKNFLIIIWNTFSYWRIVKYMGVLQSWQFNF